MNCTEPVPEAKPEGKARRICTTKSRSGCVTCKEKHAKCDETRPECSTCRRKGIPCGGYEKKYQWSSKHQLNFYADPPVRHRKRIPKAKPDQQSKSGDRSNVSKTPQQGDGSASARPTNDANATGEDSSDDPDLIPFLGTSSVLSDIPISGLSSDEGETYQQSINTEYDQVWTVTSACHTQAPNVFETSLSNTDTSYSCYKEQPSNNDESLVGAPNSQPREDLVPIISRPIFDIPTLLISRWFEQVCPIWSAFDSEMSLNRTLATKLWGRSEAVLSSLQSMSAAYMVNQIPHMRRTAFQYVKAAMDAISSEISVLNTAQTMTTVPVGLLFSLVCMGTIFGWINRHDLTARLLRNTKAILYQARQNSQYLSSSDRQMLSFFISSTQYWDMLFTFINYRGESVASDDICENSTQHIEAMGCQYSLLTPHPWTGISTYTSQLFSRTTKCCRVFRQRIRKSYTNPQYLVDTLSIMEKAQLLENQLVQLEHPSIEHIGDTGDILTPSQHLIDAAEAYRLSALVQLYQTFPSLTTHRPLIGTLKLPNANAPWGEKVVPLALHLTEILRQIPPDSGSRSLLPILYVAAGTGLRFDGWCLNSSFALNVDQCLKPSWIHSAFDASVGWKPTFASGAADVLGSVNEVTIQIGDARQLIVQRLSLLENCLYPEPIAIAKDLVRAIWKAYDDDLGGHSDVHWVDIMDELNLRSIFG